MKKTHCNDKCILVIQVMLNWISVLKTENNMDIMIINSHDGTIKSSNTINSLQHTGPPIWKLIQIQKLQDGIQTTRWTDGQMEGYT